MTPHQYLSDEDFARLYLQANYLAPATDVLDLEPRVESWLARNDMGHRNAFAIAVQVAKLAKPEPARARVPSPEEAARLDDLHQGISDQQPLTAEALNAMSMAEYGKARQQLIRRSSGDGVGIFGPGR